MRHALLNSSPKVLKYMCAMPKLSAVATTISSRISKLKIWSHIAHSLIHRLTTTSSPLKHLNGELLFVMSQERYPFMFLTWTPTADCSYGIMKLSTSCSTLTRNGPTGVFMIRPSIPTRALSALSTRISLVR